MRASLRLRAALLLAVCAGCTPRDPRCDPICQQLATASGDGGCGYTTWDGAAECAAGCSAELLRRPDADEIVACYEAAATACNTFALIQCRLSTAPIPDKAGF